MSADQDLAEFDRRLLEDASLVAGYAYRSGQLRDDSIFSEISRFKDAMTHGDNPPRGAFAGTVSKMVASMAPMTLQDLRDRKDAFSIRGAARSQFLLSAVALMTIFAIGYYSYLLNEQVTAVDAYNEIKTSNFDDKFTALRKHWRDLAETQVPEDARFDILHHEIEDTRTIRLQAVAAAKRIEEAQERGLLPLVQKRNLSSNQTFVDSPAHSRGINTTAAQSEPVQPMSSAPSSASAPREAIGIEEYSRALQTASAGPQDLCAIETNIRGVALDGYPIWARALFRDLAEELCIRKELEIPTLRGSPVDLAPQYIYDVRENIGLLRSWILPGLLGLLGATFYLLRNLYDVRTPHLGGLTAVSRVALGGVAGIAVGWLVVSRTEDGVGFSSISLVTALVAGFSVDLVFSLLDRFKKAVAGSSPPKNT
jgi:hypothetical protein